MSSWDSVASSYHTHASPFTSLHVFDLLSFIRPHLLSARTVLDIGCGPGPSLLAYQRLFPHGIPNQTLILSDLSSRMIDIAKQTANKHLPTTFQTTIVYKVMDGATLNDIQDDTVDIVISAFGVFMIPDTKTCLANVRRVLTKRGVFANAAWTDLPDQAATAMKKTGFGAEFQPTVERVFMSAMDGKSWEEEEEGDPVWKQWSEREGVKTLLKGNGFERVNVYRTLHSTSFHNVDVFWTFIKESCPVGDMGQLDEDKVARIREIVKKEFGVTEEEALCMVTSANVSVAENG